jgi:hypothetical protein
MKKLSSQTLSILTVYDFNGIIKERAKSAGRGV